MFDVLALFFTMVCAGYVLRRVGLVRIEAAKDLNQLVFAFTLPCMIFLALQGATLSPSLLVLPALGWALSFVALGLGWAVARALKLPRHTAGAFLLSIGFANTTFLGYPLIQGIYGQGHLTLAIFYDLMGTTLAVNLLGVLVASAYGEAAASGKAIARRLLLFPPMWGLVLGLALHGVALPQGLTSLLASVGGLTTPLIMLALGVSLEFSHWRKDLGLVGLVAVGRLVVLPAIALLAVKALDLPIDYQQAVTLEAAMPTMFYSLTLAMVFGLESRLVINAIMVTTVLSVATVPLWLAVLAP